MLKNFYIREKNLKYLLLGILFFFTVGISSVISAQNPTNVINEKNEQIAISGNIINATCGNNGSVKLSISTVNSGKRIKTADASITNSTSSLVASGTFTNGKVELQNLSGSDINGNPVTYSVNVQATLNDNTPSSLKFSITVGSSYTPFRSKIKMYRGGLGAYEQSHIDPVTNQQEGTGILKIEIFQNIFESTQRDYQLIVHEAPATSWLKPGMKFDLGIMRGMGINSHPFEGSSKPMYFFDKNLYNLTVGTYKFSISDGCINSAYHTVEIEDWAKDKETFSRYFTPSFGYPTAQDNELTIQHVGGKYCNLYYSSIRFYNMDIYTDREYRDCYDSIQKYFEFAHINEASRQKYESPSEPLPNITNLKVIDETSEKKIDPEQYIGKGKTYIVANTDPSHPMGHACILYNLMPVPFPVVGESGAIACVFEIPGHIPRSEYAVDPEYIPVWVIQIKDRPDIRVLSRKREVIYTGLRIFEEIKSEEKTGEGVCSTVTSIQKLKFNPEKMANPNFCYPLELTARYYKKYPNSGSIEKTETMFISSPSQFEGTDSILYSPTKDFEWIVVQVNTADGWNTWGGTAYISTNTPTPREYSYRFDQVGGRIETYRCEDDSKRYIIPEHSKHPSFSVGIIKQGYTNLSDAQGLEVTLVKAPKGYDPNVTGWEVGKTRKMTESGLKMLYFGVKRDIGFPEDNPKVLQEGEYTFHIGGLDCLSEQTKTVKLTYLDVDDNFRKGPDFDKIKLHYSLENCHRIKIDPFQYVENRDALKLFYRVQTIDNYPSSKFLKPLIKLYKKDRVGVYRIILGKDLEKIYDSKTHFITFDSPIQDEYKLVIDPEYYGKGITETCGLRLEFYIKQQKNDFPSYDPNTSYGYLCPTGNGGKLHFNPIRYLNNPEIGATTNLRMELLDFETNDILWSETTTNVPKEGYTIDLSTLPFDPAVGIPSKVRFNIFDNNCGKGNSASDILNITDLSKEPLMKSSLGRFALCPGEDLDITAIYLGEDVTYKWYTLDRYGQEKAAMISEGRVLRISNFIPIQARWYQLEIEGLDCGKISQKFVIGVSAPEMDWSPYAKNNDWHNTKNWKAPEFPKDPTFRYTTTTGVPYLLLPGPCTDVNINKSPNKPNLSKEKTNWDFYGPPICQNIHFKYEGELENQHLLHYDSAFFDLSLKELGEYYYYYYMISFPLKNMVTADLFSGLTPKLHQKYIDISVIENGQANINAITFNRPISTFMHLNKIPNLNSMALAVEKIEWNSPFATQSHPIYADSKQLNLRKDYVKYDAANNKITYYYMNRDCTARTGKKFEKTTSSQDFRFIYETEENRVGEVQVPGQADKIMGYDQSMGGNEPNEEYFLAIGNPFMSTMNFKKFYESNKDKIRSYCYVVKNGITFFYDALNESASSEAARKIPALRSFIVHKYTPGNLIYPLEGKASVLESENKAITTSTKKMDRITDLEEPQSLATIKIEAMILGSSENKSHNAQIELGSEKPSVPFLPYDESLQNDIHPFISKEKNNFYVGSFEKCENEIQFGTVGMKDTEVKLNIYPTKKGNIKNLYLYDKENKKTADLLKNKTYVFRNNFNSPANRFILKVEYDGNLNNQEIEISKVKVLKTENGATIEINNGNASIEKIQLYAVDGTLMQEYIPGSVKKYSIDKRDLAVPVTVFRIFTSDGNVHNVKFIVD